MTELLATLIVSHILAYIAGFLVSYKVFLNLTKALQSSRLKTKVDFEGELPEELIRTIRTRPRF